MDKTDRLVPSVGKPPRLIVITDLAVAGTEGVLLERIATVLALAREGTVVVQLRDTDCPIRQRLRMGRTLREMTAHAGQALAVNDRLDLTVLVGADWLHLGERSVSAGDARSVVGSRVVVSRACHEPSTRLADADAVLLSPILAARKGNMPLGLDALGRARTSLGPAVWLYALGGVSAETAKACLSAGADGVAVIGAALDGRPVEPLLEALGILGA